MEISTALIEYLDHQRYFKNITGSSLRTMRYIIQHFSESTHTTMIEEVCEETVTQYFKRGVSDRNWKPSSFRTKRSMVNSFFNWCVARGYIPVNPAAQLPVPRLEQRIPRNLTKAQACRILDVSFTIPYRKPILAYRNHAMLAVCLYAGLRKAELLALQFSDIDFSNMTIFVRCGKGRKDRIIPLSRTLKTILLEYIEIRKQYDVIVDDFFCNATGKYAVKYRTLEKQIFRIAAIARIKFTLHTLRHTFATLLLDGGSDIYSVSKLLGHARIDTTTIYLSASIAHLRGELSKHPLER